MLRLNRYMNLPSIPKFVSKENANFLNFEQGVCLVVTQLLCFERFADDQLKLLIFNFRTCLAQNACEHPPFSFYLHLVLKASLHSIVAHHLPCLKGNFKLQTKYRSIYLKEIVVNKLLCIKYDL